MRSTIWGVILFCFPLFAAAQERPNHAIIRDVRLVGTGCDANSTQVVFSPDLADLSVLFSDYGIEIGEGSLQPQLPRAQKNCEIKLQVEIPDGWSFAFKHIDYRGFAAIPASAWGMHRFTFSMNLSPVPSMKEVVLQGPLNSEYSTRVSQKPERLVFSRCGSRQQEISLLSQITIQYYPQKSDRSLAQIVLDSADMSLRQSFGIEWKKCLGSIRPDPVRPTPRPDPRPGPIRPRRF